MHRHQRPTLHLLRISYFCLNTISIKTKKSMNRVTVFTLLWIFALPSFAQINFNEGNVAEVMKMAKEEGVPIFVDVYTTWCGPCKYLSANHFKDAEVGNFFNQNFIAFKIDAEKGEGIDFAKKYHVNAYPTLLFIDGNGELLHKGVGVPGDYQALMDLGQAALDPETQLMTLQKRYEMGEEEPHFLRNYAEALANAYEDANPVAEKYFSMVSLNALKDSQEFVFFTKTITNFNSDLFQSVYKDKEMYEEMYGEGMEQYASQVLSQTISTISRERDEQGLGDLTARFEEIYGENAAEKVAMLNYRYYFRDEDSRHHYAKAYLDNYDVSWQDLNGTAWTYYENVNDRDQLMDALSWIRKSIAKEKNYYNTDTEAHLLYKLKFWKDAKKSAKVAIKTGEAEGEDVAATQALMKKIKAKR